MSISHGLVAGLAGFSLLLVSCGGSEPAADSADPAPAADTVDVATQDTTGADIATDAPTGDAIAITGVSTISVEDAAAITDNPPANLVVLDVRTPEEFAEGHLDGAVLVDFYDADFAEQLAALDTNVPYLVYCQSGNRSGQALGVMEQLGFSSAADVDGGIAAWSAAGLPVTTS